MNINEEKWQSEIWPILKQLEDKCKELKIECSWTNKVGNEYFKYEYNGLEGNQARESAYRYKA